MREEFTEHECMVRFGVVLRQPDVFIHIERDDMFEAAQSRSEKLWRLLSELSHTHESFPSFTSAMSALYVGIGDDPVGRPSTKGFSAVGAKSLIL